MKKLKLRMPISIAAFKSSLLLLAIVLNFLSSFMKSDRHFQFPTYSDTGVIFGLIQASAVIHVPITLDGICEIFGQFQISDSKKMSSFVALTAIFLNILLLCIISIFSLDSTISHIFLSCMFLQIMTTIIGINLMASSFIAVSRLSVIGSFIMPVLCVAVGLNSASHSDLSKNMTSLIMSLSLLFACLGFYGILKLCQLVSIRRRIIDPINFYLQQQYV